MTSEFSPTGSKEFFVGREEEIGVFSETLAGQRSQWVLHVPGDGGIGKTRLLQRFREIALERSAQEQLLITELLDFYNTALQADLGLLQEIVGQLGEEHFPNFQKALEAFQILLASSPDPVQRREQVEEMFDGFLKDCKALLSKGYRLVLLFDTCEEMRGAEEWVLNVLLKAFNTVGRELETKAPIAESIRSSPQIIVVMAGRRRLDFSGLEERVHVLDLPVLSLEDGREYFRRDPVVAARVSNEGLKQLYARTGGP
jgi:hypothetical protein